MASINHHLAKLIVNQPYDAIALEKLRVKRKKENGKRFNKALGDWAFRQLQLFVEYKAESLGKYVLYVNPAYTSKTCSLCESRGSRQGLVFRCNKCGLELHADLNAARNIAQLGKSEMGRLFVNEPNVTSEETIGMVDDSCKPLVSTSGS